MENKLYTTIAIIYFISFVVYGILHILNYTIIKNELIKQIINDKATLETLVAWCLFGASIMYLKWNFS